MAYTTYLSANAKALYSGAPATADGNTTIVTAPALTKTLVKELLVCNANATAAGFDLYRVTSGGAASAANQLVSHLGDGAVPPFLTKVVSLSLVLEPGDFLVYCNYTNDMAVTVSGAEVT